MTELDEHRELHTGGHASGLYVNLTEIFLKGHTISHGLRETLCVLGDSNPRIKGVRWTPLIERESWSGNVRIQDLEMAVVVHHKFYAHRAGSRASGSPKP